MPNSRSKQIRKKLEINYRSKNKRNNKVKLIKQFEEWIQIPPGPIESKEKFWKGNRYYYCDEYQARGVSQEKGCKEKTEDIAKQGKELLEKWKFSYRYGIA